MSRLDNFWIMTTIGLLAPLLFGSLFLLTFAPAGVAPWAALQLYAQTAPSLISKMILVALVPNLFGAFAFYHTQWWRACRGMFVSIMCYLALAMFFI